MSKTPKLTPEQRAEAAILYERLAGDDSVLEQFIYSAVYIRAELERELAAERERADRNQEDAERYRYLRIHPSVASETLPSSYQRFWCLVELDAAIDAARRK